jgi:hypothetical protein
MLRRWAIGIAVSLAIHAVVAGGTIAIMLARGMSFGPHIDIEITGMRLDDVHNLPLGPPPGGGPKPAPPVRHRAKPHRAAGAAPSAGASASAAAAGPHTKPAAPPPAPIDLSGTEDDVPPPPGDVRQYGPEGSRLAVILRLDRLRGTVYAPAVDQILTRLPDRRDLLEGTGLDLYQSFDALLIATPNPLDAGATFLAARHKLTDAELRAALDRGAQATGRVLTWRTERHRPFAERHARVPGQAPTRDDRLLVLPAPGLVVVTPPAYRALLLAPPKPAAADGGASEGAGGAGDEHDGGAARPAEREGWTELLQSIDAQDGSQRSDAVVMATAVDMLGDRSKQGLRDAWGLEVPRWTMLSIGVETGPALDIVAMFSNEAEARSVEEKWPGLMQRARTNPLIVLGGFAPLVARAQLTRDGPIVRLHETATEEETMRLLQLAARFGGR